MRGRVVLQATADEEQVAAGEGRAGAALRDGPEGRKSAHLQVVRKRRAFETEDRAEQDRSHRIRQGGRNAVLARGVGDHDRPRLLHQRVEGSQVQGVLMRIGLQHRQRLVGIEPRAAEAGEVLEAPADALRLQAVEEVSGRLDDPSRLGGRGAFAEDEGAGVRQAPVDDRREVHVEPETGECLPGELSRAARRPRRPRRPPERGGRGQQIAEPVDGPALLVEKEEARAEARGRRRRVARAARRSRCCAGRGSRRTADARQGSPARGR